MSIFVDTSALYAVLDADDSNHKQAKDAWTDLLNEEKTLVCTNYVLVEMFALLQHRLGMKAVRAFEVDIMPVLQVEWIDETLHHAAVAALLAVARRHLSLVDCTSFEVMRRLGLTTAFAFDRHFGEQGFKSIS